MKRSLALSVLFHVLILMTLFKFGMGGGSGGRGNSTGLPAATFLPPVNKNPIEVSQVDVKDLGKILHKKRKVAKNDNCRSSYNGIGITTGWMPSNPGEYAYNVLDVPDGYPAALAGIRPGDTVASAQDLIGEEGAPVSVKVTHKDGSEELLVLIRAKICMKTKDYGNIPTQP